jgi:pSer/pThr/pTyr-binding forkhead associated (FHA) protein
MELDQATAVGSVRCRADVTSGLLPVWGMLSSASGDETLRHNRILIGRGSDNDVVLDDPRVSRSHALVWRQDGATWVTDEGSANGTTVDGLPIEAPTAIGGGSVVAFGSMAFTFREA